MFIKSLLRFKDIILPFVALALGLSGALFLVSLLGESPLNVLSILVEGSIGSPTQLGYSLYYASPLLLTGLSVAWAFRAGLFNIGAEGQMVLGALAMSATGIYLNQLPWYMAVPLAMVAAFLVGGIWGGIAGWIKAKRGCHEVLATILLNFIAYGISSFFILVVMKNPDSQVPETAPVGLGYQIAPLSWIGGTSPLNWSFFIALGLVIVYGFIFAKTRLGFYQKLAGSAPAVGARAGINMDRQTILAMFISGGLAGLAGMSPVLGYAFKTREGFSAGAGFVGIAVALLGRNSAVGIIFASILFGVLTKGALNLDLDTEKVSRDLAVIIQALIVLAVASRHGLTDFWSYIQNLLSRRRS